MKFWALLISMMMVLAVGCTQKKDKRGSSPAPQNKETATNTNTNSRQGAQSGDPDNNPPTDTTTHNDTESTLTTDQMLEGNYRTGCTSSTNSRGETKHFRIKLQMASDKRFVQEVQVYGVSGCSGQVVYTVFAEGHYSKGDRIASIGESVYAIDMQIKGETLRQYHDQATAQAHAGKCGITDWTSASYFNKRVDVSGTSDCGRPFDGAGVTLYDVVSISQNRIIFGDKKNSSNDGLAASRRPSSLSSDTSEMFERL